MNFKGYKEGFENAASTEALYNFFNDLDLVMIELLLQKSGEFLNQQTNDYVTMDKMYKRTIQTPEKEEYDPFFRLKLPTNYKNTSEFKTEFYDEVRTTLKLNTVSLGKHLEERRWIRPIIKLDCLWYIEGSIYPNIEAHSLKIYNELEKKKPNKDKKTSDSKGKKKKKKGEKSIKFL
jgi:hypothetical protein